MDQPPDLSPPPEPEKRLIATPPEPTPWTWRLGIVAAVALLGGLAYALDEAIGPRGRGALGAACIFGIVALFSANLRAVNWRTIGWGVALQVALALFILMTDPGFQLFQTMAGAVGKFLDFTEHGSRFVFGALVDPPTLERAFGPGRGFVFAFKALPTIIFVSSFFTVLYYLGVLQLIVRVFARGMIWLMSTSGAETLSAVANVFMGQTEAPLIVKPYVARMTQSELLALMVGGMATISGGLMAVYIQMGADAVGILATSVMAAPCGLYLSKLLLPELETPETRGLVTTSPEPAHRNAIDAAAAGASDGMLLAINVAAMLIAFLAFLALFDYLLGVLPAGRSLGQWLGAAERAEVVLVAFVALLIHAGLVALVLKLAAAVLPRLIPGRRALDVSRWSWPVVLAAYALTLPLLVLGLALVLPQLMEPLSLKLIFSQVFAPLAFLMGVESADVPAVADLLGTKLALNEFVAYLDLTTTYRGQVSDRTVQLATYALTGFANFGSVGIQLGGIGAMAPERRPDLARLGTRALFVGFLATILNACLAGMFL